MTLLSIAAARVAWNTFGPKTVVSGEIVALRGTEPRALLNPISKILGVYHFDEKGVRVDFKPDVDYVPVGGLIARTAKSSIYDFNGYAPIMKPDGKFTWVDVPRNPPPVLFEQVYVDYETPGSGKTIPAKAPAPVSGSVLVAGDSIAFGAHTVGQFVNSLDRDGYVGLIRAYFGNQFSISNFGIVGGTLSQLEASLSSILAKPPGVIVIAYGMNDQGGGAAGVSQFKTRLTNVVAAFQGVGTRVILVGFFRQNPNWEFYSEADTLAYNTAISQVAQARAASFVDIDAAWEAFKAAGKDGMLEMTGDNYHHPSNYGQRIYFSAILPYLLATPVNSTDVPGYVALP